LYVSTIAVVAVRAIAVAAIPVYIALEPSFTTHVVQVVCLLSGPCIVVNPIHTK
jgi:hypothetical protein